MSNLFSVYILEVLFSYAVFLNICEDNEKQRELYHVGFMRSMIYSKLGFWGVLKEMLDKSIIHYEKLVLYRESLLTPEMINDRNL